MQKCSILQTPQNEKGPRTEIAGHTPQDGVLDFHVGWKTKGKMMPVFSPLPPLCSLNLSLSLSPDSWSSDWSSLDPGGWKPRGNLEAGAGKMGQLDWILLASCGQRWLEPGQASLPFSAGAEPPIPESQGVGQRLHTQLPKHECQSKFTHTHKRFPAVEPSRYTNDFWAQMLWDTPPLWITPRQSNFKKTICMIMD